MLTDRRNVVVIADEAHRSQYGFREGYAKHLQIAMDLVWAVQSSITIDWSLKDSVRATMRAKVRRLLARYDYPPDHEDKAVELVLEQAELFAASVPAEARP